VTDGCGSVGVRTGAAEYVGVRTVIGVGVALNETVAVPVAEAAVVGVGTFWCGMGVEVGVSAAPAPSKGAVEGTVGNGVTASGGRGEIAGDSTGAGARVGRNPRTNATTELPARLGRSGRISAIPAGIAASANAMAARSSQGGRSRDPRARSPYELLVETPLQPPRDQSCRPHGLMALAHQLTRGLLLYGDSTGPASCRARPRRR
jgi:hypothetical protein